MKEDVRPSTKGLNCNDWNRKKGGLRHLFWYRWGWQLTFSCLCGKSFTEKPIGSRIIRLITCVFFFSLSNILFCLYLTADIYDKVQEELEAAGFDTECLGGGRISHDAEKRTIQVFGYSQVRLLSTRNFILIKTLSLNQLSSSCNFISPLWLEFPLSLSACGSCSCVAHRLAQFRIWKKKGN